MDEKDIRYVCMRPLGTNRLVVYPTGSGIIGDTKKDFFEKFKAALTEDVEISVRDLRNTFRTIFYPNSYHWLDFPLIRGPMHLPVNVYACDIIDFDKFLYVGKIPSLYCIADEWRILAIQKKCSVRN